MKLAQRKFVLPLLGFGSFLIFLLWLFPAAVGFSLLAPDKVRGSGISGSVWSGEAQTVSFNGFRIQQLRWSLQPLQLLVGAVSVDASARWANGSTAGQFSIGLTGSVSAHDVQASFDLATLGSWLNIPGITGAMNVQLQQLEWDRGWPDKLVGNVQLRNLNSSFLPTVQSQGFGNFEVSFEDSSADESAPLTGLVRDFGGPVELSGTLTLTDDTKYELKVRVKARPGAPATLVDSLRFLGSAAADGTRELTVAGSI